jgi:excisionase family DNA binding protein
MESKKNLENRLENIETLLRLQALNNKTVFNIDEVAIYIGLSKQYIYKLTSRNDIPFYKSNGKVIRFSKCEIDTWLLRNRQATNEEIEQGAINHSVFKK